MCPWVCTYHLDMWLQLVGALFCNVLWYQMSVLRWTSQHLPVHAAGLRLWPSEAKEIGFDEHVELVEHEHGSYRVTSVNIGQPTKRFHSRAAASNSTHQRGTSIASWTPDYNIICWQDMKFVQQVGRMFGYVTVSIPSLWGPQSDRSIPPTAEPPNLGSSFLSTATRWPSDMEFPPECDMDFQEGLENDSPVYMVMFQISWHCLILLFLVFRICAFFCDQRV